MKKLSLMTVVFIGIIILSGCSAVEREFQDNLEISPVGTDNVQPLELVEKDPGETGESKDCEFGKDVQNCDLFCKTHDDCKYEAGYCVNVNEKVYLPENTFPVHEVSTCECFEGRCSLGQKSGEFAI